jgi:hypothetical protein
MFWNNFWWHVFPVKITIVEFKRWIETDFASDYEIAMKNSMRSSESKVFRNVSKWLGHRAIIRYETGTESEFKYMPYMDDQFRMDSVDGINYIMHTDADYEGRHSVGFVVKGARGLSSLTASDRLSQTTQPENYEEE